MAQSGVLRVPRVQLIRGLAHTIEQPTSPPTVGRQCHRFHARRVAYSGGKLILCDASPVRTSTRPASDDAAASRPDGCNDGRGAAGSRTVAGEPGAACAPPPDALAQDRGLPHEPDLEPRP